MKSLILIVSFMSVLVSGVAQAAEKADDSDAPGEGMDPGKEAVAAADFLLVRETDINGTNAFRSCTREEYRQLISQAAIFNSAMQDAYNKLRKDWRKSETKIERRSIRGGNNNQNQTINVKIPAPPFPLKCPQPKKISQLGAFPSMEKLEERKKEFEAKEEARIAKMSKEAEGEEGWGLKKAVPAKGGKHSGSVKSGADTSKKQEELMAKLLAEIETSMQVKETMPEVDKNTLKSSRGRNQENTTQSRSMTNKNKIRRIGE